MKQFLLLLLLFNTAAVQAKEPEPAVSRAQYLQRLIQSVRSLPVSERQRLRQEADAVFAGVCRSSEPSLAISCSFEASEKICRSSPGRGACMSMMDALIIERLNANRFVTARERYEMMSRGDDHKARMDEALTQRYGSLAATFSLNQAAACASTDLSCYASGIDSFCQAQAEKGLLSYQNCAAVLGLFIGSY